MEKKKMYGYIRVSSRDQNEARQVIALKNYGISDSDMYLDKLSGKDFDRPSYKRMLKNLRQGDVVVVKSIDRLGRNYEGIFLKLHGFVQDFHFHSITS